MMMMTFDVNEDEQFGDTDDEIYDAKEEDIGDERRLTARP